VVRRRPNLCPKVAKAPSDEDYQQGKESFGILNVDIYCTNYHDESGMDGYLVALGVNYPGIDPNSSPSKMPVGKATC
jgi:hypothetical protein